MAANKYYTWDPASKQDKWISANDTSAGAGDAGKLVALNASGILADSIMNASATGGTAGKIVKADGSGKIDIAYMPTGIGPETYTALVETAVTLSAGNFVAINGSGKIILANAMTGIAATGFVLSGFSAGQSATVYLLSQLNTAVSGLTAGTRYFLGASGATTTTLTTIETTVGAVIQELGTANSATSIPFNPITYGYVAA